MKRQESCDHPMNDAMVLLNVVSHRDFVEGRDRSTYGYYCPTHQRMGSWRVTKAIPLPQAAQELLENKGFSGPEADEDPVKGI